MSDGWKALVRQGRPIDFRRSRRRRWGADHRQRARPSARARSEESASCWGLAARRAGSAAGHRLMEAITGKTQRRPEGHDRVTAYVRTGDLAEDRRATAAFTFMTAWAKGSLRAFLGNPMDRNRDPSGRSCRARRMPAARSPTTARRRAPWRRDPGARRRARRGRGHRPARRGLATTETCTALRVFAIDDSPRRRSPNGVKTPARQDARNGGAPAAGRDHFCGDGRA